MVLHSLGVIAVVSTSHTLSLLPCLLDRVIPESVLDIVRGIPGGVDVIEEQGDSKVKVVVCSVKTKHFSPEESARVKVTSDVFDRKTRQFQDSSKIVRVDFKGDRPNSFNKVLREPGKATGTRDSGHFLSTFLLIAIGEVVLRGVGS